MENKLNELKAKSLELEKLINYQDGSVVSREILKLPAGRPHSLKAEKRFKMLLIMIKS